MSSRVLCSLPLLLLLLSLVAAVHIQYRLDHNSNDAEYVDLDTLQELIDKYRQTTDSGSSDTIEDSMYDGIQKDSSCSSDDDSSCYAPPLSTIEQVKDSSIKIDATCLKGGDDVNEDENEDTCTTFPYNNLFADKHWGSDMNILKMRNVLRAGEQQSRPPIFLVPGLASTRLVAWKSKTCPHHPLLSDIKIQDYVWLNINLIIQMGTLNVDCMKECMQLGKNQSDSDDVLVGCKLRPDEGLDAISSLAPGGLSSSLLVGGTNTVYAWLIQWLVENLGYDNNSLIGLGYDWRLSPDRMESRDGFLTILRKRMEAAVHHNQSPGIVVAHSMGNVVFRYFLAWLKQQMRQEAYDKYTTSIQQQARQQQRKSASSTTMHDSFVPGWMSGVVDSFEDWWSEYVGYNNNNQEGSDSMKHAQLWELAKMEGDANYIQWLERHIWTYVGLSAPLLGAVNPLRAVVSGENMGLPITDEAARIMELTFGSTHTVNPISSKLAFCDDYEFDDWGEEQDDAAKTRRRDQDLFCLDDLMNEIENSRPDEDDPWESFPVLKTLLKDRADWDTSFPMIQIIEETCKLKEKPPCESINRTKVGPKDAQTGELFKTFSRIWKEKGDPLMVKLEQLRESFWDTNVPNILTQTWDRPHIKHVILAYGVDLPTEVGYVYRKREVQVDDDNAKVKKATEYDGNPTLEQVIWEEANGKLTGERLDTVRGKSITESIVKKKVKREPIFVNKTLEHSGDGTIPYLSLSWAHTWLLHGVRARRYSEGVQAGTNNALEDIEVSHRPQGELEWVKGPPPNVTMVDDKKKSQDYDTGTSHPHGTKYKPEMTRFHNVGKSRKTGMEYSTTVIEALGVEHKETTRNYDILAAVFTDVLKHMHDDFGLV